MIRFDGGTNSKPYYHRCYLTDARSSWKMQFTPGSPDDLTLMVGTTVEELPVYLRHWSPADDPYVGNHILNRIDPIEWILDSPWDQMSFGVDIYLSKRGRSALIKKYKRPELAPLPPAKYSTRARCKPYSHSKVSHSSWKTDEYIKEPNDDWNHERSQSDNSLCVDADRSS